MLFIIKSDIEKTLSHIKQDIEKEDAILIIVFKPDQSGVKILNASEVLIERFLEATKEIDFNKSVAPFLRKHKN